jgi:HSP20 family protein
MRFLKRHRAEHPSTPAAPAASGGPTVDVPVGIGSGAVAPEPSSTPAPPTTAAAAATTPATTAPAATVGAPSTRFDKLFDGWMAFPFAGWTNEVVTTERADDGALLVHAQLGGLDPVEDVELTVSDGMLWIDAARRDEQRSEENGIVRHEVRFDAFTRSIPLPDGVSARDVVARAHDDVLEIRIPAPRGGRQEKVPVLVDIAPSSTC